MRSNKPLCMIPGPVEFDSQVLRSFAHEGISHVDPQVLQTFSSCIDKLRKVFFSPDGQPLIMAGSGTLGWDMVGVNLLEKNDSVLVINTGYFGDHFGECLASFGAQVTHLKSDFGSAPSLDELQAILNNHSFHMVTITHVDTSTGVLTDIKGYAQLIRKYQPDALIIVDSVCSLGGESLYMTEYDLDYVLTGSQKCIGVPAGLSLSMIRPRAIQKFQTRSSKRGYYLDWTNWLPIMQNYEQKKPSYFATPSVNHIFALNTALTILLKDDGMEQRFLQHKIVGNVVKEILTALGFRVVTQTHTHAHTLTCVMCPTEIQVSEFISRVYAHGVSIAGGLHPKMKGTGFRLGHMGPSSRNFAHIRQTIQAIEKALSDCKYAISPQTKKETRQLLQKAETALSKLQKPYATHLSQDPSYIVPITALSLVTLSLLLSCRK